MLVCGLPKKQPGRCARARPVIWVLNGPVIKQGLSGPTPPRVAVLGLVGPPVRPVLALATTHGKPEPLRRRCPPPPTFWPRMLYRGGVGDVLFCNHTKVTDGS